MDGNENSPATLVGLRADFSPLWTTHALGPHLHNNNRPSERNGESRGG